MLIVEKNDIWGSGIFDVVLNLAKNYGSSLLESAGKSLASEAGKHIATKVFAPPQTPVGLPLAPAVQDLQLKFLLIIQSLKKY